MNFETIICHKSDISIAQFWKALNIWLNNPHVVNRRILVSTKVLIAKVKSNVTFNVSIWLDKLKNIIDILKRDINGTTDLTHVLSIIDQYGLLCDDINLIEDEGMYVFVKKLLPRKSDIFSSSLELTIIDRKANSITCFDEPFFTEKQSLNIKWPYRIQYEKNGLIVISVQKVEGIKDDSSVKWLKEQLFLRLLKWMENEHSINSIITGSLNLISPEKYVILYNRLKIKYSTEMIKSWPESTDPAKFVYEDIAIATYLLILWEKERDMKGIEKRQSFLDLGCGNGLLVHILTGEGHPGLGIDLRKRKIWDLFPKTTCLEVRTITPSSLTLFPEIDWLIGNHSDELTPWIPVIAARSSYNCRFFLIPCCAYEFNGKKYQRDTASKSQYVEYMQYIKYLSEKCGFKTDMDKLRIPSTKRICLVGWERTYPEEKSALQDKLIQEMIGARSKKEDSNVTNEEAKSSQWSRDFKPRDSVERVRNCTQLDKDLIANIVNIVATYLLRKVRLISLKHRPNDMWNAGGQIELSTIVKIIPLEMLKQLKSECGGLQTLLKNHSHIFQVIQGTVQLKVPGLEYTNKNKRKRNVEVIRKMKPCWFHGNHPNGCPLVEAECNFKH